MPGTYSGAMKTTATNKKLYGEDYYKRIGKKGGENGRTGGFYGRPDLARKAGRKGGIARRGWRKNLQ
jgi:general stress protein YciG